MSVEENKALIRRGVEEVWNKQNVDILDELATVGDLYLPLHRWQDRGGMGHVGRTWPVAAARRGLDDGLAFVVARVIGKHGHEGR
jgi:hypothetical protein